MTSPEPAASASCQGCRTGNGPHTRLALARSWPAANHDDCPKCGQRLAAPFTPHNCKTAASATTGERPVREWDLPEQYMRECEAYMDRLEVALKVKDGALEEQQEITKAALDQFVSVTDAIRPIVLALEACVDALEKIRPHQYPGSDRRVCSDALAQAKAALEP